MNDYYVYAYLREDGTPYYIGKGRGRRAWKYHRNIAVPKDKKYIKILYKELLEKEAFNLEEQTILKYGRKDIGTGILRNRSNGGEGNSGLIMTESSKEKLRQFNLGKKMSTKTLEKMRIAAKERMTPELRKKISETHKQKGSKPSKLSRERLLELVKIMQETNKGKHRSEKTKQKISNALKGKKKSEESKEKQREKMKGKIPWNKGLRGVKSKSSGTGLEKFLNLSDK